MYIGSTAIKHYYPDFSREPHDIDIAVETPQNSTTIDGKRVEYLENPVILKYQKEGYLNPDLMLTLKVSHMFYKYNWDKHMYDIQFLLKKGHKWDIKIIEELRGLWENILPKIRRSQLAQSKADFFDNAVNEDIDEHDYLHTLINPIPMYTLLLKEGSEVELEESKFHEMTFEQKCEVVREETYVMAWERYKDIDYRAAFKRQLKDNIMKHFPQYIALFAIENYVKLERPTINYRNLINNKLEYDKV